MLPDTGESSLIVMAAVAQLITTNNFYVPERRCVTNTGLGIVGPLVRQSGFRVCQEEENLEEACHE